MRERIFGRGQQVELELVVTLSPISLGLHLITYLPVKCRDVMLFESIPLLCARRV